MNQLEDDKPWYCKLDYIRALVAIAAVFPQEMSRKTHAQGKKLGYNLWCAAAPQKLAWQWNALSVRRTLPSSWMTVLPAGTTSNESLHAELNRWWRNSPEQFPTTLHLYLAIGHLGKLLAHNAALYSPTVRQVSHDQVLALAVRGVVFLDAEWKAWCEEGIVAELPLFAERQALAAHLAAAAVPSEHTRMVYAVHKRPADSVLCKRPAASTSVKSAKVKAGKSHRLRRTSFQLKRSSLK